MAVSDLHMAMVMLSSADLAEQGRLLGVEPLLEELRIVISDVCALEGTPDGIMRLTSLAPASFGLRNFLEEVLARRLRAEAWHQVSATFPYKNLIFIPEVTSKLKSLLTEFTAIASSAVTPGHEHRVTIQSNSEEELPPAVDLTPKAENPTVVDSKSLAKLKVVKKMLRILLVDRIDDDDGPLFLPLAGGLASGKTLLARTLFNDARVMRKFDVRVWIDVSQSFDLSGILWRILGASLGASHTLVYIEDDQAVLKSRVREALKSNERYLIVLDDAWSEKLQEWHPLLQALPSNGTLVLTSRIPAVASCVATIKPHPLKTMNKKLQSIFVHLWQTNTEEIQSALNKKQPGSKEHQEFILQRAHASYFHLPLDMRKCLLYCSVFPPEYKFDPEELADLLAADGQISPAMTQTQRVGFVQKLFDECFHPVEESGNTKSKRTYIMHSILRTFAMIVEVHREGYVISTDQRHFVMFDHVPVEPQHTGHYLFPRLFLGLERLRTIILLHEGMDYFDHQDKIEVDKRSSCQSFKHLRILNLQASFIRTLPRKFDMLTSLRYLNLSWTNIEKIPRLVSKLQFLQTLILSHCKKLRKLHDTTSMLVQLQKLDLEGCYYLVDFAPDMTKMKSLRFLNIHGCSSLSRMPYSMGQLTNLEAMLGYVVPNYDGRAISELQPLANLMKLSMENLENISNVADARDMKLEDKQELESLAFQWNKSANNSNSRVSEVLECLRPNQCLKVLEIVAYEGSELPSWMTGSDPYLISLVEIRLVNLIFCETLPPLGLLPLLKVVEISGAEMISSISDSFYGSSGTFPSLEKVTFSYMSNLELWEQPHRGAVFPCLAEVTIMQCPKLALRVELPSVTKLILWMNNEILCSSRGALGYVAQNLKHVSISFCQELIASSVCKGLQDLRRLKGLELYGCDEMTYLPQGLRHLSSLRSLTIVRCNKLETLPDWLENLSFLYLLRLSACPALYSIPEVLRQRRRTRISIKDCPKLSAQPLETAWERYEEDDDEELFEDIIGDDIGGDDIGDEESTVNEILTENFGDKKSAMSGTLSKNFGGRYEIASDAVEPDLHSIVMNTPGFTEEQLYCAFSHLLDNEAQGGAFVDMTELRRLWWIGNFLAKHFQL